MRRCLVLFKAAKVEYVRGEIWILLHYTGECCSNSHYTAIRSHQFCANRARRAAGFGLA